MSGPRRKKPRKPKQPQKPRRPPVRKIAASIVRGVLAGRGAARTHLERALERDELGGRAQGLLTELVYGTVRRAGTLDYLLDRCARKGLGKIEEGVLAHLRVASYQLLFLDHVPAAVAVSEAAKAAGSRAHVRGFVNGLLRGLARKVSARAEEPGDDWRRALPGRNGWLILNEALLPDVEQDPAGWLAVAGSLPRPLAASWLGAHGLERALELARASNDTPPITLRVNRLRATREEALAELETLGVDAAPGADPWAIALEGSLGKAEQLIWRGTASVQDETALAVAPLLQPRPGERLLDLCSAPGGKTTHLGELLGGEGSILATDVDEDRLGKVGRAASRLGLRDAIDTALLAEGEEPPGAPFDGVLADVPCSNTGVLRRRVEVRWRLATLDRPALLSLQAALLDRAAAATRPGGRVVYSTCSIEAEENRDQVEAFLARAPGWTLEEERQAWPESGGHDGGYAARLRAP